MKKTAKKPDFEMIHDKKHYQNVYYNDDLKLYMTFSIGDQTRGFINQNRDVRGQLGCVDDYPSVYHIHKPDVGFLGVFGGAKIMRVNIFGQTSMLNMPQGEQCHRGATFMPARKSRYSLPLIQSNDHIYHRQKLGLVFLENGQIATKPEIRMRLESMDDQLKLYPAQEDQVGYTIRKLNPLY